MAYVYPSISDFKAFFFRDFPYGTTNDTVMDADILKAMQQADVNFAGQELACSQNEFNQLYLYLTAHYLVMDLRMGAQGMAGNYNWLEQSKSVGSVSASYAIPQRILDNPELAYYSQTNYGAKYLSLILPSLCGQMFPVMGRTWP